MRSVRTEATDGRSSLFISNVVVVVARQHFVHRFNVIAIVTIATCIVTYRRLCITYVNVIHILSARNVTEEVKVKESRNRPGLAQRVPGGLGSQIFMTFGT